MISEGTKRLFSIVTGISVGLSCENACVAPPATTVSISATSAAPTPEFLTEIPDTMIETEWASFKNFELAETAIPNKYKELIGLAVSGATRCRYCVYFHTEAAKLFGATDEEVNEAALMAKHTMGWSTYLNTRQFDYDRFKAEFDRIAAHVRSQEPALV